MTLEIDEENVPADPIFRTFMDRRGVGHGRALPFDDAIRPEVHSQFTAMIGGNDVATCAKTWFFGSNPGSGVIFLAFLPTPHNT